MTSYDDPSATDALGPALLFCPGDRPERFAKAVERADTVILDLEDAVAPGDKDGARAAVEADLSALGGQVFVRVNAADTPWFAEDVAMLHRVGHRLVMLPKATGAADLDPLEGLRVLALCETARGVLHAEEIAAHPACEAVMWGGEDLVADLGGRRSRGDDGRYHPVVEHARTCVLLAAGAAGKTAVDGVHLDIADVQGLRRESLEAMDVGFGAKACIHPSHVAVIREAFAPTAQMVAWAHGVLDAATREKGVFRHDGRMVDEPVLRQARATLARLG
ncbi:MAG: CoA ester lyase [Actinomycetota bacterium]|nr:CoA ester lyase [Actinomycetota bacterium]